MKKSFKTIKMMFLLGFVVIGNSCSDYLDKQPTDALSSEIFYQSKNDFEQALTACYGTLQNHEYTWSICFLDCITDNGYEYGGKLGVNSLSRGPIVSTTNSVDRVYRSQYKDIARFNLFLRNIETYQGTDIPDTDRKEMEAQVKVMRAMAYFELYKYYGAVPLVLEPLTYETQNIAKSDSKDIFTQIKLDVDFGIKNLPDMDYAKSSGHLVKSAAQMLKARVLLFDAYNDNGEAKIDVMTEAKNLCAEIIETDYYKIAPTYRGLFCDDLGEQSGNPEYLFSVNYLAKIDDASSFGGIGLINVTINTANAGGGINPLQNFVDEYDFVDGTSFSKENPLYNADNVYKNRDPRMSHTMFSGGTVTFENGHTSTTKTSSFTGFYLWKMMSGSEAKDPYFENWGSDWPKMRYAEVLLMYAEAANEIEGPSNAVQGALNQIRNRSDVNMPNVSQTLTKDEMRNVIRKERRIELAFEGFRYDDVKRWKIAEEKLNLTIKEAIEIKTFEKKNYHLPLPQSEIDISYGVLMQNSDY